MLLAELGQLALGKVELPGPFVGECLAAVFHSLKLLGMRLLVIGKPQIGVLELLYSPLEVVKVDFHLVLKLIETDC